MKEIYHCTPTELEKQDDHLLNLHFQFLQEERKREHIQNERAKQKANQKNSIPKQ